MPLDADDLLKVQQMIASTIPRLEYESRHSELEKQMIQLRSDFYQMTERGREERDKILMKLEDMSDKTSLEVREVGKQVDDVKEGLRTNQATTLRYLITVIVSFVLGIVTLLITLAATHVRF